MDYSFFLPIILFIVPTRSMQGMFGASVSELYLLIKIRSMCDHKRNTHAYTGTVSQVWL